MAHSRKVQLAGKLPSASRLNDNSTDSDIFGRYTFTGLPAGNHVVREVVRDGWRQTAPVVNLLINGSFEAGPEPGDFITLPLGSTDVPGWVVTAGDVDVHGTHTAASDGSRSVDLDGQTAGAIAQTFATTPGEEYLVRFDMAGNPDLGPTVKMLRASAAGTSVDFSFDITGRSVTDMGFQQQQFRFIAAAATTTLEFRSLSAAGNRAGPVIDRVVVTAAVRVNVPQRVALAAGQTVDGIDFGNIVSNDIPPNRNPVISSTAPTAAEPGATFRYAVAATDPDGDALTFDLPARPDGMTIHPSLGVIAWTATGPDDHDVIVRARDGKGGAVLQSFRLTVGPLNTPPVITSQPPGPAGADRTYQYRVRAQDADGDPIGFTVEGARGDMAIAGDLLTWRPTAADVGTHTFSVVAIDQRQGATRQTFTLDVVATAANRNPEIVAAPRTRVRLGDVYTYFLDARDPDGDPLTYELVTAPNAMIVDTDGIVAWKPIGAQFGPNPVVVKVTDGRGGEAIKSFTVTVASQVANRAPVITSRPPTAATVDRVFTYDVDATDADDDFLAYSLTRAPAGMSIDPLTGAIRWQPTAAALGPQPVTVQVADTEGGTTTQDFSITVRGTNLPPAISSTPPTTAASGREYRYAIAASDPEGGVLRYELTQGIGTNMRVDEAGVLTWTPDDGELGPQALTVRITDDRNAATDHSFTVVVSAEPNTPQLLNRGAADNVIAFLEGRPQNCVV